MADIRVFISSVQHEFAQERRLLCDYIRTDSLLGRFFVPFIFEDMPATEISAQKAYLTQAAACHIYIGIFGTQYGYEDEEGLSPTEREYNIATANHAHRLTYTLRTDTPRHPKEQTFINMIERDVVRRSSSNPMISVQLSTVQKKCQTSPKKCQTSMKKCQTLPQKCQTSMKK